MTIVTFNSGGHIYTIMKWTKVSNAEIMLLDRLAKAEGLTVGEYIHRALEGISHDY